MKKLILLSAMLSGCSLLTGCVVMGYSSRGGLFVWPGSIAITVILLLVWLLFRRR